MSPFPVENSAASMPLPIRQPKFQTSGAKPISLADRLSQGDLEGSEVLRYATDLAADLAERHRGGSAHGAIAAESVVLAEGSAELQDARGNGASPAEDAVQFAALLREMARAVVAGERVALGAVLGALSGQYLTAPTGVNAQTFRKLVLALKIVRLEYRSRKPPAEEAPAEAPTTEIIPLAETAAAVEVTPEAPAPRGRKIRLLIRAVPSGAALARNHRPAPRGFLRRILG